MSVYAPAVPFQTSRATEPVSRMLENSRFYAVRRHRSYLRAGKGLGITLTAMLPTPGRQSSSRSPRRRPTRRRGAPPPPASHSDGPRFWGKRLFASLSHPNPVGGNLGLSRSARISESSRPRPWINRSARSPSPTRSRVSWSKVDTSFCEECPCPPTFFDGQQWPTVLLDGVNRTGL